MRIFVYCFLALLLMVTTSSAQTVSVQIIDFRDDVEEELSGANVGNVFRGSSDLELGNQNLIEQAVGLRFLEVPVRRGAIINSASIQFTAAETDVGTLDIPIFGELAIDAVELADIAPPSSRQLTTASVDWNVDPWFAGDSGVNTTTPDLTAIVQEIVDQPNWSSGNAMVFIFQNDPLDTSERIAVSFDGNPTQSAVLHVDFTFEASPLLGDVNLDSVVNFLDIAPFIAILSAQTFQAEADISGNEVVDFLDIAPFIAILSGQ